MANTASSCIDPPHQPAQPHRSVLFNHSEQLKRNRVQLVALQGGTNMFLIIRPKKAKILYL